MYLERTQFKNFFRVTADWAGFHGILRVLTLSLPFRAFALVGQSTQTATARARFAVPCPLCVYNFQVSPSGETSVKFSMPAQLGSLPAAPSAMRSRKLSNISSSTNLTVMGSLM